MSRDEDVNIKMAIDKMLDTYKIRKKFDETSLIAAWPEIIGPAIANRTQSIYIRDRKLFVKVESAVVKNELILMRSQIIKRMNEQVGQEVIDDLILL